MDGICAFLDWKILKKRNRKFRCNSEMPNPRLSESRLSSRLRLDIQRASFWDVQRRSNDLLSQAHHVKDLGTRRALAAVDLTEIGRTDSKSRANPRRERLPCTCLSLATICSVFIIIGNTRPKLNALFFVSCKILGCFL
jgi:hypothetical protein